MPAITHCLVYTRYSAQGYRGHYPSFTDQRNKGLHLAAISPEHAAEHVKGEGPTHLQLTFYSLVCYCFCFLQYSQSHFALLRGFQRMITVEPITHAITHSDTVANNETFLILKRDFAMYCACNFRHVSDDFWVCCQ